MEATLDEYQQQLFGPGGPFALAEEEVCGEQMQVIRGRKRSLRDFLVDASGHGDAEYIVHDASRLSYREHERQVASVARALREKYDVQPGDRVAILAANCSEWVVSFWATVAQGAIVACLNGWWTADEIVYGVELSQPKVLIGDRKRLARVNGIDLGVPVVEIESSFPELIAYAPDAPLPRDPIDEDDAATILFTSGTTGRPKGAVQTHRGLVGFLQLTASSGLRAMMQAAAENKLPEENAPKLAMLVTAPLFHVSGLQAGLLLCLMAGGRIVFKSGRFDPLGVLETIEREKITTWAGLGSMAPRVLNHPDVDKFDLSSIRNLGQGGAPTSASLLKRITDVAPNGRAALALGYGLSESVTTCCQIGGDELWQHPASVGRPAPTHQLEIRDEAGNELSEGQEGEIHVRSPYIMREYWRNPEATAKTIKPGRWLATGDIGHIEDGRLYINSRARDLILRAAENIYPVEIEHRLETHPSVNEAAVIGVDHPELGQEVKAVVVLEPDSAADAEQLASWCREALAAHKIPVHWELRREPLPRNAAGKLLKNVLEGAREFDLLEE